jgi:hypothetical protein
MFVGYDENSVIYNFLVLKRDVLDYNTIIEIKNLEFFEHICHTWTRDVGRGRESYHLVVWFRVARKPECTSFIRDSKVRD